MTFNKIVIAADTTAAMLCIGPRHRRMQWEPLLALCFGIATVLDHSLLRMMTTSFLSELHVAGVGTYALMTVDGLTSVRVPCRL